MARGINKVILVGNLGNDPEVKYTQGGMAITKTSLATSSVRKDRDGNQQEKTEWHRVTFFGKLGEIAAEYLRKGSQVYVEGEIRYSEHTGDDGQKRYYASGWRHAATPRTGGAAPGAEGQRIRGRLRGRRHPVLTPGGRQSVFQE